MKLLSAFSTSFSSKGPCLVMVLLSEFGWPGETPSPQVGSSRIIFFRNCAFNRKGSVSLTRCWVSGMGMGGDGGWSWHAVVTEFLVELFLRINDSLSYE